MAGRPGAQAGRDPRKLPSRNAQVVPIGPASTADSLTAWAERYQALAVRGVRSEEVATKIALHLGRFLAFFADAYGHDRASACLPRDVVSWRRALLKGDLAPATVNNHLASLGGFTSWVAAQAPGLFANGNPTAGVGGLALPPLEPRALSADQVRSLKNLCDRLPRLHERKGRRWAREDGEPVPTHAHSRPWRDRAIVYVLLSTGLRREELVRLDLGQLAPPDADGLRKARRARLSGVRGKGGSERHVFLSSDARTAVADYFERERHVDKTEAASAMFLTAATIRSRSAGGRLSPRAVNLVLARIGSLHDAEVTDPARRISPLRPHDLRHTFAFNLAEVTGADSFELERRLGHRSARYIARYTNPPEDIAAGYVEDL